MELTMVKTRPSNAFWNLPSIHPTLNKSVAILVAKGILTWGTNDIFSLLNHSTSLTFYSIIQREKWLL